MTKVANTAAARMAKRWTPPNGRVQEYADIKAVIWSYERGLHACVCIFHGTKVKPVEHCCSATADLRDQFIKAWVMQRREQKADEQARTAKANQDIKEFFEALEIGSIFYTLSGYEQTNATFYEVVGRVTANSVVVRPIEQDQIEFEALAMYGHAIPRKGQYIGTECVWKVKQRFPALWKPGQKVNISWYG